jgi:hypothetical protein
MPGPGNGSSMVTFSDGNLHVDFTERTVIFDHRPASLRNRGIQNAKCAPNSAGTEAPYGTSGTGVIVTGLLGLQQ